MSKYIKKEILPSEVNFKLLSISGEKNKEAREVFKDFLGGKKFTLETHKGIFQNAYFNENTLRLMCHDFFKEIKVGDVIYLQVKDANTILITDKEPSY
jgi:DNA polymerase III epsilon subunit-like protein